MSTTPRLLVVIEDHQQQQPALERACYLVDKMGGEITVILPIYDFAYDASTAFSANEQSAICQAFISHKKAWLTDICQPYQQQCPITIKVVWHRRAFEAIILEVLQHPYQLLLKTAHQPNLLESVVFTPTDYHLLRKCPCPVWMVKDRPWPSENRVLIAVNLADDKSHRQALNHKLIKESQHFVNLLNQAPHHTPIELHIMSAYPATPSNIVIDVPNFDPQLYNEAIRSHYLLAMKELRQQFSVDDAHCHVAKGHADEAILRMTEQLQAGVVVLGTIGRSGISAALLGNTAEQIISHLRCDLLAIKPDDFRCPISLATDPNWQNS